MGRSAKFTKRPSKEQKAASKMARDSRKPLPPPAAKKEVEEQTEGKAKKRQSMRAKVDKRVGHAKVGNQAKRDLTCT